MRGNLKSHRSRAGERQRFPVATDTPPTPLAGGPGVPDEPLEILEVRPAGGEDAVTITIAMAAQAIQAMCTALSEQLARRAQDRAESAEDVLALREHGELAGRLQPFAEAGAHAVIPFSQADLQMCLPELIRYVERADGEHYQAPDLRRRLELIKRVVDVFWEANAAAATAGAQPSEASARRS
jgi:hypothetical protein